ncbi:MAG: stage II sporulation protein P [Lachnospiraceae bacterium]|nr:stage II sporulation protein P [Lachnospiraceae bacterium]
MEMHPLYRLQYGAEQTGGMESASTYEILVTGGIHDENELDENGEEYDMETLAQVENEKALEKKTEEEQAQRREEEQAEEEAEEEPVTVAAGTIYNMEELSDFEFLFENFYTMDKTTTIAPEDLNAEILLSKDMSIDKEVEGPQILIYHTHSQEGFIDSVPGDNSTTIVGVGEYLARLLREKGYDVMHVTSVYDLVDGKLDRNEAYSKAQAEISAILEENPGIQSVIDLHRDGVAEGTRLVTEIDGKTMARFMFFNGLSRTKKNGPIEYLYNPYIQDNLALTLQLKLMSEQYYPGLARNIYLRSLRYNLHLSDKALLIEAGAQTNTLQEMLNTMEPLSDILDKVFDP